MNRYDHALGRKTPPKPEAAAPKEPKAEEAPDGQTQRQTMSLPFAEPRWSVSAPAPTPAPYQGPRPPIRIVWADGINADEIENLRQQIDLAMSDPNYTIITNYQVHWEEFYPRVPAEPITTQVSPNPAAISREIQP